MFTLIYDMELNTVIIIALVIFLLVKFDVRFENKKERFSLSQKPMETEWSLLNHNPYDNIDYQTPTFYKL